jgi:flavodoxin
MASTKRRGVKMKKIFKIILVVLVVIIIVVVAFAAIIFLDVAAYTATGSQTLASTGTRSGKALVIYDPGLSGTAKGVADKVAGDLQAQSYTVTLAGIKSSAAAKTSGYSILVVGGPIYAGSPTVSVKDCLSNLKLASGTKVGVFGSGQGATSQSDIDMIKSSVPTLSANGSLSNAIVVKIGDKEDLNLRASDFVNQLVK